MNKKAISLLLAITASPVVVANEFDDFKAQQQQLGSEYAQETLAEFEQYKLALEAGFQDYKQTFTSASKQYAEEMTQKWGSYKASDHEVWVNYPKEGGRRESVNFETGIVEVEILVDKKTPLVEVLEQAKKNVVSLLNTTEKQAFENDVVAQKVEEKLKQHTEVVKTAKLSDQEKVLAPLVKDASTKTDDLIQKLASVMVNSAATETRHLKDKKVVQLRFKIPENLSVKAERYSERVLEIAKKENIPVALVYAVMETESNFNPRARSAVPAYGLMQIVPVSAGKDASKYLFGKAKVLSPSYLYNGDKNIEIGGAYLHILYHRYLKKVDDTTSRLFCAIAAYNTGAGNVAKSFVGSYNFSKAADKINQLSASEVYRHLRHHLPYDETKHYIKRVAVRMAKYQS